MPPLIPCPHCRVHCKLIEDKCPHCSRALRGRDGTIQATAAAALLGLTLAASACGDSESTGGSTESTAAPEYGVAAVGGNTGAGGNAGGMGGSGAAEATPDYGVPGVGGSN